MIHRDRETTQAQLDSRSKYFPILVRLLRLDIGESLEVRFDELEELGVTNVENHNTILAWIYANTKGRHKRSELYGRNFTVRKRMASYLFIRKAVGDRSHPKRNDLDNWYDY